MDRRMNQDMFGQNIWTEEWSGNIWSEDMDRRMDQEHLVRRYGQKNVPGCIKTEYI